MTHNPCPHCRKRGGIIVAPEAVGTGSGLLSHTTMIEVYSCGACKAYIGIAPLNTSKRGEAPDYDYTARTWNRLTEPVPAVPFDINKQLIDTYESVQRALPGVYKDMSDLSGRVTKLEKQAGPMLHTGTYVLRSAKSEDRHGVMLMELEFRQMTGSGYPAKLTIEAPPDRLPHVDMHTTLEIVFKKGVYIP